MEWGFDGRRNIVTRLTFNYIDISEPELVKMNALIAPLDKQAIARVYCADGAMEIAFFDAQSAGTIRARQIKLDYKRGEVTLIQRYRFD